MTTPRRSWRPVQSIRAVAIGLIWRNHDLLLSRVFDDDGNTEGWRPMGGAIEFGELGAAALKREFLEEIGEEISAPRLLTALENLYEHYGMTGHEIVFVYETEFVRPQAYDQESWTYQEETLDGAAEWVGLDQLRSGAEALYPEGLLQLLEAR